MNPRASVRLPRASLWQTSGSCARQNAAAQPGCNLVCKFLHLRDNIGIPGRALTGERLSNALHALRNIVQWC